MFIGNYSLGDTVPLYLQCVNGSRVASAPDAAPAFTVYDVDGTAMSSVTGTLGASNHDSKTGLRRGSFVASSGNSFDSGIYHVLMTYAVSSTNYAQVYSFRIV